MAVRLATVLRGQSAAVWRGSVSVGLSNHQRRVALPHAQGFPLSWDVGGLVHRDGVQVASPIDAFSFFFSFFIFGVASWGVRRVTGLVLKNHSCWARRPYGICQGIKPYM